MNNLRDRLVLMEVVDHETVRKFFEFADPELEVDWGEKGPPLEYTPGYIVRHPHLTQIFIIKNEYAEIIAGSKVSILRQEEKSRLALDHPPFGDLNGALLEYTLVRHDYRNQKILQVLTKARIDWAKARSVDYVCAEIGLTGAISAYTKARDGFLYTSIQPPGYGITEPYLVAVKMIRNPTPNELQVSGKQVVTHKVTHQSYKKLKELFNEGWVGTEVTIFGENTPWYLTLAKTS